MLAFVPGDEVICRVLYGEIVGRKSGNYESEEVFQVLVSGYEGGYLLLIPDDVHIRDGVRVDADNYIWYDLTSMYIGCEVVHCFEHNIVKIRPKPQGIHCSACGEFSEYAEANKGDRFICYLCRSNPIRCYY